ncbi:dTDP-glucose 4,6-dehydratase [Caproiciproducens sp. NJN-50]|uniref:dTDP-glucose 4,6-dehydratase n=1 Tax=Acutalibacteraceae TaxID=3082771 RepID=UPI000FFDFC9F|nr:MULTISPECIES: dTDP-glucose 4,6-dehydratase [Acutalibacteraceae]QAT50103.1 dTDP-glucose 4,6-dehydratase [Caproiciproducens sp. NJN-50]
MKIAVTGGAGFIGGNFIRYLLKNHPQDEVVCFDALTYAGNLESLGDILERPGFTFLRGDITNRSEVDSLFEKERPDILVNFAAESHVDRSIQNPGLFLQTNTVGTGILLDACRKFGIERFHQVSTDEVYGDLPLDRRDLFFTENTPINTSSPYSASKASADLLAMAYHRTYQVPVTISRCSNNYGPYQFPEKLIPLMIANALQELPLPVYGKGANIRDWLYVEDHCSAIDLILRKGKAGEIYNIGGHNERANLQVVKAVLRELDKPESLIRFVTDRPGHDLRYAIDPTKIHRELGWLPTTKFEDGIHTTIEWYLHHKTWREHIATGEYRDYYEKWIETGDCR